MRSHDACVWSMPSRPESQAATDGIAFVLVHEQKSTAPNSSGSRPLFAMACRAACSDSSSSSMSV